MLFSPNAVISGANLKYNNMPKAILNRDDLGIHFHLSPS